MKKSNCGFTLIELLFSASIAVIILGAAFAVSMQLRDTSSVLEMRSEARMDAERALHGIRRELGQASLASLSALPAASIGYRVPLDRNNNGTALDGKGNVELSGERIIQRDAGDANRDGIGGEQLVLVNDGKATVLANGLAPDEIQDGEPVHPGLWFESVPGGVRVTLSVRRITQPDRRMMTETFTETIHVRNP